MDEQNKRGSGDNQKRASFESRKSGGSDAGNKASKSKELKPVGASQAGKSGFNGKGGLPAKQAEGDWIQNFGTPVAGFEHKIQEFITSKPLATAAIAIGAGLAGAAILKKVGDKQGSSFAGFEAGGAGGFLTKGLSDTLHRFEDQVGRLSTRGVPDVKDGLIRMVSDDLSSKPFESIATMVGLGYGLAHLDVQSLKRGAFRVAKLLAMRSLDEMGNKQQGIEGESYGQA
jgi:hypothetical protein